MHRFHIDLPLAAATTLAMPAQQARHIVRVLRMREGDELVIFNGRGGEFLARIRNSREASLDVEILSFDPREAELPFRVTLWQGISSQEKMSWTIEKSVELGVSAIVPLIMQRSVVKLEGEGAAKRVDRFQAIARSASEQCGRNRIAEIAPIGVFEKRFPPAAAGALKLLLSPGATRPIHRVPPPASGQEVILFAGPEGGFAPHEVNLALTHGFAPVSLGARILRTETAAPAALAMLAASWDAIG